MDEGELNSDSTDIEPWRQTPIIRDCNTLVLGSRQVYFSALICEESVPDCTCCFRNDYPIWRRYDWALAYDSQSECIIFSGQMMTVVSAEKEASEKV